MTWLKENVRVIGAMNGVLVAFAAVLQLVVVGPMNARFDDLVCRVSPLQGMNTPEWERWSDRYDLGRLGRT